MKFESPIPLGQLLSLINYSEVIGNMNIEAKGVNEIHKVTQGDITFVDVEKYYSKTLSSEASIVIINKKLDPIEGKVLIVSTQPFVEYNKLADHFSPRQRLDASRGNNVTIHPSTHIEPGVVIGNNVSIGEDCHIQANCYIGDETIIGNRVIIEPGSVIASDAFYYKKENNKHHKWTTCGRVVIGDDVSIGACSTINRGVSGDTVVGQGSKLDCHVHIGHGVLVGENCLMAGQVAIGGKAIIEDDVTIYGQVGIAQNTRIGKGAVLLAKTGVSKNLEGGKTYYGVPAAEVNKKYREMAWLRVNAKK